MVHGVDATKPCGHPARSTRVTENDIVISHSITNPTVMEFAQLFSVHICVEWIPMVCRCSLAIKSGGFWGF